MTRYRDVDRRLQSLHDITAIMRGIKSLSLVEGSRLLGQLENQRRVVSSIEQAATDFLRAYPIQHGPEAALRPLYAVIGSERGFCGDFNETLFHALERHAPRHERDSALIAIGYKLVSRLENDPRLLAGLEGPIVAEEISTVLNRFVTTLSEHQRRGGAVALTVVYHDPDKETVQFKSLLPPFAPKGADRQLTTHGPILNLSPRAFYADLIEHYLYAALQELFLTSLIAEHQQRVRHLEGALDRQEQKVQSLIRKRNMLWQETVTEEIEVILLSATTETPRR